MGAWGTSVFDNDEAADFANEIEDAGSFANMRDLLDQALTTVISSDEFLDNGDASVGVAAAALIAAWNDPELLGESGYAPETWPSYAEALPAPMRIKAGQVLDRVRRPGDDNEHFLLWHEAGEWDTVSAELQRYRSTLP